MKAPRDVFGETLVELIHRYHAIGKIGPGIRDPEEVEGGLKLTVLSGGAMERDKGDVRRPAEV